MFNFNERKNQKGFSLVELMVVVAIIGILAAVAIPNFQRFQRQARQSEAKTLLGGIHTSQAAFRSQWETYTTDLVAVGFSIEGSQRYNVGFSNALQWSGNGGIQPIDWTAPAPPVAAQNDTPSLCALAAFNCTVNAAAAVVIPGGGMVGGGAGLSGTYVAGATAPIGGANDDEWTMDNGKDFLNTVDGTL